MTNTVLKCLRKIAADIQVESNGVIGNTEGLREEHFDNPNLTPEQNEQDWRAFNAARMAERRRWNESHGISTTPVPGARPGNLDFTLTPNTSGTAMSTPMGAPVFTVLDPAKDERASHIGPYGPSVMRVLGAKPRPQDIRVPTKDII